MHLVRQVVVAVDKGNKVPRPAVQGDADTPDVTLGCEPPDSRTDGRQVVPHL